MSRGDQLLKMRRNLNSSFAGAGWILDCIIVENFKSYEGRTSIGPLQKYPFIAVIGPNGSGKSNLMDAVSFVMGERTSSLRVKKLDELIHGASIGKPTSNTASVSAVFKRVRVNGTADDDSQNEIVFTRTIRGTSSEYLVGTNVVSQQAYFETLKNIGINAKGKNFLVFQGAIESIALKNAKERATLLEELCGSASLKKDYESAKARLAEVEKEIENSYAKKKAILVERKEVRMEVEEAECYNELLKELADKETEIAMFKLFHIEKEVEHLARECYQADSLSKRQQADKEKLEAELEAKKKARAVLSREMAEKEVLLKKMDKEKNKKMPKNIEIKQKVKHLDKKLLNAEKALKHAQDNKLNHDQDLEELRKNLAKVEKERQEYLELHSDIHSAGNCDVTLKDSQMKEYCDLKQEVLKKSFEESGEMEQLAKQKRDKEMVYNSLNNEKINLEAQLDILDHKIHDEKQFVSKARENMKELKALLRLKEEEAEPLRNQIEGAKKKIDELRQQLEVITAEIDTEKLNIYEIKRQKRLKEVIKALKDHFSGVFGRVTDLCQPTQQKYKVAITKVIGSNMNAIVVDSVKTVKKCIQYLQEQMIEPETFLPLDLLQVKPLRERFRDLKNQNIYLAFDLLKFNKEVERAILHCTKSTVICPTAFTANQVASGELFQEATNAVSLDGTKYNTNGTLSGGAADLRRKAQKWNETELNMKEEQKARIQEELRENMKIIRNEMNLKSLEQEICGIKKRLEYANETSKIHIKAAEKFENERKALTTEQSSLEERWQIAKAGVLELASSLKKITSKINVIEDKVFAKFCRQIGIPNIRVYEESDVRELEEFNREKQKFESTILTINMQIEDEHQQKQSMDQNITRWKNTVQEIQQSLQDCREEETRVEQEMASVERKILNFQEDIKKFKKGLDEKTNEIETANQQLVAKEKILLQALKSKNRLENLHFQKKLERHDVYKYCKLTGIAIPFRSGSLDAITVGPDTDPNRNTVVDNENFLEKAVDNEDRLEVDFRGIPREMHMMIGESKKTERKEAEKKLENELNEVEKKIGSFQAPNLKADQKLASINQRAQEQNSEFEKIRVRAREARQEYEGVKIRRYDKFMECFQNLSRNIDSIYKGLTQNASAQAVLGLENAEEPYLSGVSYHCVAPGKPFQSMNSLSGGEKTLAALALLFALQRYEPAPFFVLDEIDAALDNTNVSKVTSFIRQKSKDLQVLVISLKEDFFQDADALLGVTPDVQPSECIQSKVYTLDLAKYAKN